MEWLVIATAAKQFTIPPPTRRFDRLADRLVERWIASLITHAIVAL
jgi:hypothetical protein